MQFTVFIGHKGACAVRVYHETLGYMCCSDSYLVTMINVPFRVHRRHIRDCAVQGYDEAQTRMCSSGLS